MSEQKEKGLLERWFGKSGDALEEQEQPVLPPPAEEEPPRRKSMRELMEDLERLKREGEGPGAENLDEVEGEAEFGQYGSSEFRELEPTEKATPEEEAELERHLVPALQTIYIDELPRFAKALKASENLYQDAALIAFQITKREYVRGQKRSGQEPKANIFFGMNGMLQSTVDAVFEVAQQVNAPGATDPNQYAAAVADTYRRAGEYLLNTNDERALAEVEELATSILMRDESGADLEDPEVAQKVMREKEMTSSVRQGIEQGLMQRSLPI